MGVWCLTPVPAGAQSRSDPVFDQILDQYVRDGFVYYAALRAERGEAARGAKASKSVVRPWKVAEYLDQALELANQFAPEHMCLMVSEPWRHVGQVKSAGVVFLGEFSHEVLGDYVAGPSHVMPTGGTARFSSGLGVHSFVKITPVLALSPEASLSLGQSASTIARAEGLTAHAEAAEVRQEMFSKTSGA